MAPKASDFPVDESIAAADKSASNAGVVNDSGCPDELLEAVKAIQVRGIRFISHGSRMPSAVGENGRGAWKLLTKDEQEILRRHRDALKDLVRRGALPTTHPPVVSASEPDPEPATPPPAPAPVAQPPEPVVYVGRHRITEEEVLEVLDDAGLLADYHAGRLLKSDAYGMTKAALQQHREFNLSRPTPIRTTDHIVSEARQPRRVVTRKRGAPILRRNL